MPPNISEVLQVCTFDVAPRVEDLGKLILKIRKTEKKTLNISKKHTREGAET